jgi:protein-S-isoprenylcysteine O-methyltransferase Ste14
MEIKVSRKVLIRAVVFRVLAMVAFLVLIIFIPAGSFSFWPGWVYLAVILIPFAFAVSYFLNRDPSFLERRMRMREKEKTQAKIQSFGLLYYLSVFIIPGLDYRWNWSSVPVWLFILAEILVLTGYFIIVRVFKENSFASRIVEVDAGQKVIDTGPYALVRHPMYVGVILMYSVTPLALGSLWALIPGLFIIPMLVMRILGEEKLLALELDGYSAYMQKVKWRLLPGIW